MSEDLKDTASKLLGIDEDTLSRILATVGQASAEGMRRSIKPDNVTNPGISAFSYPEGEQARPKPKLTRETYFCGALQRDEQLTPEEIDAFNAITTERTSRNGTWKAWTEQNGSRQRLHVFIPNKSLDDRMNMPNGLILILKELADGQEAVNPISMMERIKQLEAQLNIQKKIGKGA